MNRSIIKILSVVFFVGLFLNAQAQDKVILKNGDNLDVRITEAADDYIKYYHFDDPNKVEVKMNRSLIRTIKYEYGREEEEVTPGLDESYFVDDKGNLIKLNFTALGQSVSAISYERAIDPFSSFEGEIKIHGVGVNNDEERSGFGINAAYKVKMGKLFKKNDYRPNHLLHGFYFRPDAGANFISFDNPNEGWGYTKTNYIHGGLDVGKQWIMNNVLALDLFLGYHYYGGTFEEAPNIDFNLFEDDITDGDLAGINNSGIKYGARVGFVF